MTRTDQSMTPHDRVLAVYRRQPIDRVAVGIYQRYLPRGAVERAMRNLGLATLEYHPVVSMIGPPWHLAPGYLSEIRGAEFTVAHHWNESYWVEQRRYQTPVGSVTQEIAHDPGGAGSEHIRKHYVTCKGDYAVVKYLVEHTALRRNDEAIRARMADLGSDGVLLGRMDRSPYQKCLIELVGPQRFLVDLQVDPAPALELMDAIAHKLEESFAMAVDSCVEVIWQPDNITSDMTPPKAFREHCLPGYRKYATVARQSGKPYLAHVDGRTRVLAELIRQSGFDVMESLSLPEIGGDLTLTEARRAFPDSGIVPNLPANWCIKDDDALERSIRDLLLEAGTEEPFMVQVSEDLPPSQWKRVLPILCRLAADGV